ncbi:hypothetical protein [uncultured Bacteroides sp.]|uniref:hypothetical protein n=1 Tax=uncultured Bacteroides sp. TaxID=162156 RepID=UPI002AAAD51F|nr:hypothetical protein [uncultured Bacteroides sp.]
MKEITEGIINQEWLTRPTGDPFADAGGFAIKALAAHFPQMNILELIDYVTKIYVEKWGGKLNAFFLNSKITQPAFKGQRKIDETLNYFSRLLNETEPFELGFCRITGQETKLFFGGRDNSIMTGSGTLINFHHFFQKGISISKEALIRIHFVPFACQQLQGKICLIQSSNQTLSEFFVNRIIEQNLHEIAINMSDGVAKSDMNKPANALFQFVNHSLSLSQSFFNNNIAPSIALYHFTNFGASPEIQIYQLHAKMFIFYRTCLQPKFKDDWQKFVRSYFFDSKHKGARYNSITDDIEIIKPKETERIKYEEYQKWFNVIYNKLLNEENIRPEILRWSRKNSFNFKIVEIYQQNIIGMKQATITKIKELASFLVEDENPDKIKKRIQALSNAKNASALRRFLLKDVVVKNYANGNKDTIISVEDYNDYLFPDGSYWGETRDLLLIAIYQELHERELIAEVVDLELVSDEESEINNL